MATKRMFSREIVQSDAFLDMPSSTQALYFQLGMEADDEGFIGNPKRVQRNLGATDDDMKILIGKRFVIVFDTGVLVVKHHRINNNFDSYNNRRTKYLDELGQLNIKENMAYTLDKSQGLPVQTEIRLKSVARREEKRREIGVGKPTLSFPVREVKTNSEGEEKSTKKRDPRDRAAWALREKLYTVLETYHGKPPVPHMGDYVRVVEARKSLSDEKILEMMQEAVDNGAKQIHTVREVLTARNIQVKVNES